jgi:hypothetical protein
MWGRIIHMQLARAALVLGALTCGDAIAAPAVGAICDTGDRIFVVDAHPRGRAVVGPTATTTALAGKVTVIARSTGKRAVGTIAAGSAYTDACGGEAGGHAGCSESCGSTVKSRVLGKDELFLGDLERRMLIHGDTEIECRDVPPWIAACATPSWFAVVVVDQGREVIRIVDSADTTIEDDVTSTVGGRFVGARAKVSIGKGGGTVDLDGAREGCLAVYRAPR